MELTADESARLQQCARGEAPSVIGRQPQPSGQPSRRSEPQLTIRRKEKESNLSSIEQRFHDLANPLTRQTSPSTKQVEQFGYSIFSEPVSTFAPTGNTPVSNDYLLGPGDTLTMLLWGRINQTLNLPVQRDGTVLMPRIGPLPVAGLTFEQAKKLIESRTSKIEGVQANVTMGLLRTIQVFVMGKVEQPGLYTVSALSHVSNALVAAGGISKVGSLRNVELRRGNQLVRTIDLYGMLLRGDASNDLQLESRDVLFVPVIGPVVGVVGDVKSPAIYELKGNEDLTAVLRLAGGVGAFGYAQRLQVERVEEHRRSVALDVDLSDLGRRRVAIRDGDLVKVFPVLQQQQNVVVLKGNVNRPGTYQWYEGMRVADLIGAGEGLADHTYLEYASIRRRVGPTEKTEFIPVELGTALEIRSPSTNLQLGPRDELTIYSDNDLHEAPTVAIRGAVRKPGVYPLTQGMKVSDLVFEAGGTKEDAYLARATLARTQVADGSITQHVYADVDLRMALDRSGGADLPLRRDDEIFVQQASNWHKPWEVKVEGEVMRPGPYVIREGERLSKLLQDCGGPRMDAYLPALVFVRQSIKETEQQRLNESQVRMRQNISRLALTPRASGEPENAERAAALANMEKVLADTAGQQATGRVVLTMSSLESLEGSPSDLVLENSDIVAIPKRPSSVNVLGQVYNPVAIVYESDLRVKDYLQRAGGPTEGADQDHIFVVKADGAIITDAGYRDMRKAKMFPLLPAIGGGLQDAYLRPGDTIYVPEKLIYVSGLKYATDVTQIIANSATALAVIGILGSHL
jgi:protein involved in polysaccharide export with SLBB domain